MSNKHNSFIKEIVRQISHPINGLTKSLSPSPVSLNDWKKCLSFLYGWVNIGINDNMANAFRELRIGEVVPTTSPNMYIYNNEFASNEIGLFLGVNEGNDYRVIINYHSFSKLISLLLSNKDADYCNKFSKSMTEYYSDIKQEEFWMDLPICEKAADILKNNDMGEVIVNKKTNNDISYWKESDSSTPTNPELLTNPGEIKKVEETKDMEIEDIEPYRVIMNNETLLKLIEFASKNCNKLSDNLFEQMGGEKEEEKDEDDEFERLFGKLKF